MNLIKFRRPILGRKWPPRDRSRHFDVRLGAWSGANCKGQCSEVSCYSHNGKWRGTDQRRGKEESSPYNWNHWSGWLVACKVHGIHQFNPFSSLLQDGSYLAELLLDKGYHVSKK